MLAHRSVIFAALVLGGCASPDTLAVQRSVFSNPYVPPVIDQRVIGPDCKAALGRDATCLETVVVARTGDRRAVLANGESVRLTRGQARILRERTELIEERTNQPSPPLPAPRPEPSLPIASAEP